MSIKLTDSGRQKVKEALEKKMIKALATSQKLAPVDTGRLRSSLTYVDISDSDKIGFALGTPVNYAPHQEFGTENMPPQPFLRPALKKHFRDFR